MEIRIDLLVDDNRNPLIEDGDFVFGESDNQHVRDLVDTKPGDIPEFPLAGMYLEQYIQATDAQKLKRDVGAALALDGYNFTGFEKTEDGNQLIYSKQ